MKQNIKILYHIHKWKKFTEVFEPNLEVAGGDNMQTIILLSKKLNFLLKSSVLYHQGLFDTKPYINQKTLLKTYYMEDI